MGRAHTRTLEHGGSPKVQVLVAEIAKARL